MLLLLVLITSASFIAANFRMHFTVTPTEDMNVKMRSFNKSYVERNLTNRVMFIHYFDIGNRTNALLTINVTRNGATGYHTAYFTDVKSGDRHEKLIDSSDIDAYLQTNIFFDCMPSFCGSECQEKCTNTVGTICRNILICFLTLSVVLIVIALKIVLGSKRAKTQKIELSPLSENIFIE